jgi:uncharacterized repeat protein (TIGR01451 family)
MFDLSSPLRRTFARALSHGLLMASALLMTAPGQAQTAYGISRTQTFIINPTTGVATAPTVANNFTAQLGYESSAMAVSPLNGLLYVIERTTSVNPRIATWNPSTGAATNLGATLSAVSADILRSTFCPDGRFYVAGNGSTGGTGFEIYDLNPNTRAVNRTLVITGIPTAGSGDISCVNNGDLYTLAASDNTATAVYRLYRLSSAQLAAGGTQAATTVGPLNIATSNAPNGLVEVSGLVSGCASPCLLASGSPDRQVTYSINSSTGAATTLTTASGAGLVDLSREFPRDVSGSKTVTPTVALQGQTLTYTIRASNAGPAVAGSVSIIDTLNPAVFDVPASSWTCSVTSPGSATALPTACGAASGTGNISTFANLSINSTVTYTIQAPLLSSFTGNVTNSVALTLTGTTVDVTPSNNVVTVTSTVTPAANLGITKTNSVSTLVAGSTTTYTIAVNNSGPANATNTVVTDPATTGLSCSSVTCSVASGAAVCPVPPALSIANLQGSGVPIATFPANSSLNFLVTCNVTATGVP